MKMYNIEEDVRTSRYYCYFTHDGVDYYASLCHTLDRGNECMIFPRDSWGEEVYQKVGIDVTEENLIKCIKEFVGGVKND
jgi:hypothetical protein